MDTILINLDFPETTRDKFKQEKVGTFVHATGQPVRGIPKQCHN